MAITANPAVESSVTSLDSFLQKDVNLVGSWADQCDDEKYCNSMNLNSGEISSLSFGADNDEGWNKVKSKSERLESKNLKPSTEDRFKRYPKYRYKTHQFFASQYTHQRKCNPDSPYSNRYEQSAKASQNSYDLANSESGESDSKQTDTKEKTEYVDAPVPKINPWSKSKEDSKCQTLPNPSTPISSPEMATNVNRKLPVQSSPRLPSSCGWGKAFTKGSNSSVTTSYQFTEKTSNSPSQKDQSWPSLSEVSPKSTISIDKYSPESLSSLTSSNKVTKKKMKQRTKSDRNKSNTLAKLDLDDSDSSKDNFVDESSTTNTPGRRKKGRQRWTTLDVDVKPVRRGYSHPGMQRSRYRPRQHEREFDRSYSAGNDRYKSESDVGNRRWNSFNRGRYNRRRAKGRGSTPLENHDLYDKQSKDEAFEEFQYVNEEFPPSQLVIFDGYPQYTSVVDNDVQVFIADENYPPFVDYVQWQIEYYFSPSNLEGDFFLRRCMDKNGFVPISLISKFRAIENLTNDEQLVAEAAKQSSLLEVKDNKVRCKEEPEKWVMEGDRTDLVVEGLANYGFAPGYDIPVVVADSEERFSSVSYDSACYVLDETLCQYQANEQVSEDLLSRSEMWKWVDAPVFIPKKSASTNQDSEKLCNSESSEVDYATCNSVDKQSDSGVSGSFVVSNEGGSVPVLRVDSESELEKHVTTRLRKTSLEEVLNCEETTKFDVDTTLLPPSCSPTSKHRQLLDSQI